ncbi:MAG: N-acetylmuramoyl-L-alanine amidase, partial [Planctomycetota bacterium]
RGGGQPVTGQGEGIWYTIQLNDSLASLNRRSGIPTAHIIELNDLSVVGLRPGARIWLPGIRSLGPDPLAGPEGVEKPTVKATQKAAAKTGHYELVSRSAWTNQAVGENRFEMGKINRITVHHTDEHAGMADLSDIEVIRRIEQFHRNVKHWAAIGYHYLVGKDGKVYEGRPVKYQGAHVSANNENNLGISVIGDFDKHLPNPQQLVALKAFLDDQRTRFSVPKSLVYGHRELKATLCPGDALMGWVQAYRRG